MQQRIWRLKLIKMIVISIIIFLVIDFFFHKKIFREPTYQVEKEVYYKRKIKHLQETIIHIDKAENIFNNYVNEKRKLYSNDTIMLDFLDYIEEDNIENKLLINEYKSNVKEYYKTIGTNQIINITEKEAILLGFRKESLFNELRRDFFRYPIITFIVMMTIIILLPIFLISAIISFIIYLIQKIRD